MDWEKHDLVITIVKLNQSIRKQHKIIDLIKKNEKEFRINFI